MKLNAQFAALRLAVIFAVAAGASAQDQELTVGLVREDLVPLTVLIRAERTACWIYAAIGVKLKFSGGRQALSIQFDPGLQEGLHPGAFGYAQPFAQTGTRIHVFFDRLRIPTSSPAAGALLGHVLAHELGHVLEGFDRHSEAGVMKAHWDHREVDQMPVKPLSFSAEDVAPIRWGVATVTARSKPGAPVAAARR